MTSNSIAIQTALQSIADFEQSPLPGMWAHLSKATIVQEMRSRVTNPFSLNQGQQPFCGPTAIVFELIRKQPDRYVKMCRTLFESAFIQTKTKQISAPDRLRSESKGNLQTGQVDWMLLATLRQAESLIFPVDPDAPTIIRNLSGMSFSWEMCGWVSEILGYNQSLFNSTFKKNDLFALQDAINTVKIGGVAFPLVNAQGLFGTANSTEAKLPITLPNHWIVLLGNLSIQGDRISFDVYSWGKQYRIDVAQPTFEQSFFGVAIGLP